MSDQAPESVDENTAGDEALREGARARLGKRPDLQLIAEIYEKLRASAFEWWTPSFTLQTWPASTRMEWLRERPDLRQAITTALTGLPRRTAREKSCEFQAELIESVREHGDATPEAIENAFSATDVALYGPARLIWNEFRARFPWHDDAPAHQQFVSWLLRALLVDRFGLDNELTRKPILTPVDLRAAIDPTIWHTHLPLEIRVAIDTARMKLERSRPREPFHARNELAIATPEIIAANLPLWELAPIIAAADAALQTTDRSSDAPISQSSPISINVGPMANTPMPMTTMSVTVAPPVNTVPPMPPLERMGPPSMRAPIVNFRRAG